MDLQLYKLILLNSIIKENIRNTYTFTQSRRYKSRPTNTVRITVSIHRRFSLKIAIHASVTACLSRRAIRFERRFRLKRIFRSSSNGQPRRFLQMAFEDRARLWKGFEGRGSPSRRPRCKCGAVCGKGTGQRGREKERVRGRGEFFRFTAAIISKSIRYAKGLPGLIRDDVHLVVLALRLPEVANRERSCLLLPGLRRIANPSSSHSALSRMPDDDSLGKPRTTMQS